MKLYLFILSKKKLMIPRDRARCSGGRKLGIRAPEHRLIYNNNRIFPDHLQHKIKCYQFFKERFTKWSCRATVKMA